MNKNYEDLLLKEIKELLEKLPPNVRIRVYYDSKEGQAVDIVKPIKHKPTLSQRLDKLEASVNELAKAVKDGFEFVHARLDNVEKRLDYNGLQIEQINKRLDYNGLQIEQINKRLDYNGLQIEQINKRLDYNNLKKLPEVH